MQINGGFYFFVQNLSEWHFSNRKDYNELWRKELGKFSQQEEGALEDFRRIRSGYPESRSIFEKSFFTSEDPLENLREALPTEERNTIKEVFTTFSNKFEKLYRKDLPSLKEWEKQLSIKVNNAELVKKISNVLSALYNTPTPNTTINVYLLFSTPNHTGGGANIDGDCVTLEISRFPSNNVNHAISVIWHEVIHIVFEKQYFLPLIRDEFPDTQKKSMRINEIAAASLFPHGVLSKKFLGVTLGSYSYLSGVSGNSNQLLSIMEMYVSQNRALDSSYIKSVAEIIGNK